MQTFSQQVCFSCEHGNETELATLLRSSSEPLVETDDGNPLHHATTAESYPCVSLLVKDSRIDINAKDKFGRTPLHIASTDGTHNIVELLLEQSNINVNLQDVYGRTPLHEACFEGRLEVVKLLSHRTDTLTNIKDRYGWTAVEVACISLGEYYVEIVEYLLDNKVVDMTLDQAKFCTKMRGSESVITEIAYLLCVRNLFQPEELLYDHSQKPVLDEVRRRISSFRAKSARK
mmetsp:Transcript_32993/g.51144  ORF Transcript_32993/g.51144 Transcript_32993/m.51144 type:complete len:232 (-) Transcript_32993:40-735(-)